MKVLVVHNRYRSSSPSGENRVVDQEHAALAGFGHEVRRFERNSDDIAAFPARKRALVPAQVIWNPATGRDLGNVLESFRPDVVHAHNLFPLLSPSILQTCNQHQVPCVVTLHNFEIVCPAGTLFHDGSVCHDCVGRRIPVASIAHGCYRGSPLATTPKALATVAHRRIWQTKPSAYIFLSEAQRRELRAVGFPESRMFVKPNLIPPTQRRTSSDGLIVYLGRLAETKGLRVLMKAWQAYEGTRATPDLRLAIAGTGPLEAALRAWAQTRPSVEVLGLLDRAKCSDLVARASAVVVPSEWPEPFGLVVIEAMASGVPPIATNHGAFPDLITDGHDGVLYPPGDPRALSLVFDRIGRDPKWVEDLGDAAFATYQARFDPSRNATELERIYRFAIANPRWRDKG